MKLAIIHGKIVTMSDKEKEVIPGGTLLVKDGIIERILENKEEIPNYLMLEVLRKDKQYQEQIDKMDLCQVFRHKFL